MKMERAGKRKGRRKEEGSRLYAFARKRKIQAKGRRVGKN
jgi:hypothetical protein